MKLDPVQYLLSEEEIIQQPQSLSAFFRDKSEKLQEQIGTGFQTLYPQEKIAEKLNISTDQLRQKLYGKKPLTRDWLIAICAAYGLDDNETSQALSICDMPTLDDVSRREKFIVQFLKTHRLQSVGIFEFNDELEAAGLAPLDVSFRKNKKRKNAESSLSPKYKEIRPRVVKTYASKGDPYNSLATQYLPGMRCVVAAFLEGLDRKKYLLEAYSDGIFQISEEGVAFPTITKELDSSSEFYPFFSELSILARKQKQKLDDVINDTKNYRNRFSANIKNDRIHIFYEEFNYSMPERNEYYLMEYVDGHYQLSVAYKSMFMQEYLSSEKYYDFYHTLDAIPRKTYLSLEDIDATFENRGRSCFYPELQKHCKYAFSRMQKIVEDKLSALLRREIFIQNLEYIFDEPGDILKYYKIDDIFHCEYDPEFGEVVSFDDSVQYANEQGILTEISFDDIKLAFELGIESFSEICRIKTEKGSIAELLK